MSWDKNTFMFSDITPIVRELIRKKEKYHLFNLGTVNAMGVNDTYNHIEDYNLRILIYSGGVILEQMRRTEDCDSDDCVVSESFNFDEVPDKWALERFVDYTEFTNSKEYENFVSLDKYKTFIVEFIK